MLCFYLFFLFLPLIVGQSKPKKKRKNAKNICITLTYNFLL
nr:MAG TPA: hypothetical protein [Caudoviricetes sp.]